jgi:S1-C subfamily serine protease
MKAGMQKGDIILKMGELDITDINSYMKALGLFKAGQTIDVVIKRGNEEMVKSVTF